MATGTSDNTRNGNYINIRAVKVSMQFQLGTTQSTVLNAHIALVRMKQQIPDTAPSSWNEIFEGNAGTYVMQHQASMDRYEILWQKFVKIDPNQTTSVRIDKTHKFPRGLKVAFNGTTANDIEKNGLYLVYIGDAGANNSAGPSLRGQARLTFDP